MAPHFQALAKPLMTEQCLAALMETGVGVSEKTCYPLWLFNGRGNCGTLAALGQSCIREDASGLRTNERSI